MLLAGFPQAASLSNGNLRRQVREPHSGASLESELRRVKNLRYITTMRIRRTLCLTIALVMPQLAQAKLPLSEDSLGKMESILDFCAQADAQGASKYQERKKVIAGEASEKEVAEARKTKEYSDGYEEISNKLAEVPMEKAIKACTAYLEGGK